MPAAKGKKSSSVIKKLLAELNGPQRAAVKRTNGPVLVLAGAGSGKTRVLTYRIAYLIHSSAARPSQIMAMTFTNKAAGEMRERVMQLIPRSLNGLWIGTFHSLFARILRREAQRLGFDHNYAIYDTNDQINVIKSVMTDLQISQQQFSPKAVQSRISSLKNSLTTPEEFTHLAVDHYDETVARIYPEYQRKLKHNNAMDFDDLLLKPIELFEKHPTVLQRFQDRFTHLLVDEYQDTNRAQYVILKMLAKKNKNICVVGDDDQSIYGWRGADIRNILDFEKDYPDCAIFRLEQNYRSTKSILAAAHSVVLNNRGRHEKELWTEKGDGELVTVLNVDNETDEALKIVREIEVEFKKGRSEFNNFAILYRTNAQSRALEDGLRSSGIPYTIVGGVRFYERKEVKDVLAYLRLICNPRDSVSLRRIINFPARGIGEASLTKLEAYSLQNNITLYEALSHAEKVSGLPARTAVKVLEFFNMLDKYRSLIPEFSPAELSASMVEEAGILRHFKEEGTIESLGRAENVDELLLAIAQFSNKQNGEATLQNFLEEVALVTDVDSWDEKSNAVTLMTLHSAKGLEFPVVFIAGLEEGLFPLSTSFGDPKELEEERRLFYVGATRAKERLVLSWARGRRRYGGVIEGVVSRFINEIDPNLITYGESLYLRPQKTRRYSRISKMPKYEDESQEVHELDAGVRVRHSKFGDGTVLDVEYTGSDFKITVAFDRVGSKKLIQSHAKLEIL